MVLMLMHPFTLWPGLPHKHWTRWGVRGADCTVLCPDFSPAKSGADQLEGHLTTKELSYPFSAPTQDGQPISKPAPVFPAAGGPLGAHAHAGQPRVAP